MADANSAPTSPVRERTRTTRLASLRPPGAGALFVAQGASDELTPFEIELLRQFMIVLQRLDVIEKRIDALVGAKKDRVS